MPQSQPITVELREEQASLDRHLASGDYDSPSEDLGAGVQMLVFSGRVVVGCEIAGAAVYIVHIIYAGRDYGADDFRR